MPIFRPIKKQEQSRIPNSQYIKTDNKPDKAVATPAEPDNSPQPEAK